MKGRCNLNNLLMTVFTISLKPVIHMTDEQFYELCRANPDVKFERSATGANDTQYNEKLSSNFQKNEIIILFCLYIKLHAVYLKQP